MNPHLRDVAVPNDWDRRGLPGWSYHSPALLELEKEHVFRNHWQIAGHVSDVPNAGDYLTMDVVGERALIVRGKDGVVRGFHNLCRHRGSRVVADNQGTCKNALVCPFHGWVYNLDGTLRGAARPRSFPDLDKTEFGLMPLDLEIWMGFIFIRFRKGPQPSVAELMKPIEAEIAHYDVADMVPSWGIWTQKTPVNWKSVRDVDNEGYHVAMAHPALQDLYGATYFDEPFVNGVSRSFATYNPHAGRRWSVQELHQDRAGADASAGASAQGLDLLRHLPEQGDRDDAGDRCSSTRSSRCRPARRCCAARSTATRDESREQAAARYLAYRIDRDTMAEDVQLSVWSNESMLSRSLRAASICPTSNMACAPTTTICASCCRCWLLETAPDEKDMWNFNEAMRSQAVASEWRMANDGR